MHDNHGGKYGDTPNKLEVEKAIKALIRGADIDREYDVPYVAGCSVDGSKVYIDYSVPDKFRGIDITGFLVLHEAVEKGLMEYHGLTYQEAHALATLLESSAVELAGHDYGMYRTFLEKFMKEDIKHLDRLPPDLDPIPYKDEGEVEIVAKISAASRKK